MSFLELAAKRYSVRKFSNKAVDQEKVNILLEAVRLAPTAANNQPQRILVIEGRDALEKLKDCTYTYFDATIVFLICYDEEAAWKRNYDNHCSGEIDASIITTHIMMAATDIGLGSTCVGHFDPVSIRQAYNIPSRFKPVTLLPIGYPSEDSKPTALHTKTLSNSDMVFYNSF